MPDGRPSIYSQEIADKLCAGIIEGYSLRTVCKPDEMPCVSTVLNWLRSKPNFLAQYEKAKEEQADALAEEMLDIADDGTNDWMEKHGKEGEVIGWQVNGEHVQRSRLRLDTRKWIASKLKPKKYGDRVLNENQALDKHGQPADQPKQDVTNIILSKISTEELEAALEQAQNQHNGE
jgi:hypothetical protein